MIYLVIAYACFWLFIFYFIIKLRRDISRLEKEVEQLRSMKENEKSN